MAKVSGQFGEKRSYYKPGKFHEGVDLAFNLNDPIKAYAGGTVSQIGFEPNGYGNYLKVRLNDGRETIYAHANGFDKKVGDFINAGDVLGRVGSTGRSTGPHLHFGLYKNGKAINPMEMINGSLPQIKQVLGGGNVQITPETNNVINEWAKKLALQNMENESRKLSLQENNLKMINDLLNKPQQRVTPVTLDEVLLAPKGEKLATYAKHMQSPQWQRSMGNLIGTYRYNPRTGEAVGLGDKLGQEAQEQYNLLQKNAATDAKNRNDIVLSLMKEFGVNDRFDRDLNFKTTKQAQDYEIQQKKNEVEQKYKEGLISAKDKELALGKLKLEETKRHNHASEGISQQKADNTAQGGLVMKNNKVNYKEIVNINGKSYNVKGLTLHDRNKISENSAIINSLNEGLKVVSNNPKAFGLKGATPAWIQGQKVIGTPAGKEARARIGSLAKEYKKYLTGVASNKTEEKDFLRYVPAPYDSDDTLISKINSIKKIAEDKNKGILDTYYYEEVSVTPQNNNSNGKGWAF